MAQYSRMEYKVVVLGMCTVGKSSLIDRFMGHSFCEEYVPTIEDIFYRTTSINMEGETCLLEIVDTSGDPLFLPITERQFRRGDVFVVVFAVDNFESYEMATDYIKKICLVKDTRNPCVVMVANKCELKEWAMDLNIAKSLAESFKIPFIETSSKYFIQVNETFLYAAALARKHETGKKTVRQSQTLL